MMTNRSVHTPQLDDDSHSNATAHNESDTWQYWQTTILSVLRLEYADLFPLIRLDEVDWDAWRPLFEQGCTPRAAIEQAISSAH